MYLKKKQRKTPLPIPRGLTLSHLGYLYETQTIDKLLYYMNSHVFPVHLHVAVVKFLRVIFLSVVVFFSFSPLLYHRTLLFRLQAS